MALDAPDRPTDSGRANSTRGRVIGVALVASFMTLLDVSIVNVAIPSIQTGLHLGSAQLQWVLSGYALTFGLFLVPAGRFGDARGRRGIFVAGLALFTLASVAAGSAQSAGWLVAARLVQGAAAGAVNPQVTGLIQQLYAPKERSRPFGYLGAVIGLSTAVGPLLGGLLVELAGLQHGWRWVFLINIPIGVVGVVLGWRWLPTDATAEKRESLDPVGVVLLGAGVVALLLPLVQRGGWPIALVAVALLGAFVAWERHHREPVVDLALFRTRSYGLGTLIALLYFAGFTAIFFIFTLFLQDGLREGPLVAGLAITPFAVGSGTAATIGARMVNRFGRAVIAVGLGAVALGLAGAALAIHLVPGAAAPWATVVPFLVAGLGSGCVISPNQTLTLAEVPVERAGSAGGVLQTAQRIGAAIGIAGVGAVFFTSLGGGHDYQAAVQHALLVAIGFVLVALAAALTDILTGRERHSRP